MRKTAFELALHDPNRKRGRLKGKEKQDSVKQKHENKQQDHAVQLKTHPNSGFERIAARRDRINTIKTKEGKKETLDDLLQERFLSLQQLSKVGITIHLHKFLMWIL